MCHYLIAKVRLRHLIGHKVASQETDTEDRPSGPTTNHSPTHGRLHPPGMKSYLLNTHLSCINTHERTQTDGKSFLVLCSFPVSHQIKPAPNLILNSSRSHLPSSPLLTTLLFFWHTQMNPIKKKGSNHTGAFFFFFFLTKNKKKKKLPSKHLHTQKL